MHRTIIVGSPRVQGRCAALAQEIFDACIEEAPQDGASLVAIASVDIAGCTGCDACKRAAEAGSDGALPIPDADDPLAPTAPVRASDAHAHVCVIADDMAEVRKHVDAADELIVVAPVYFAGPPAQLKALLDRLQPYYWSDVRRQGAKRPLALHVVGEGGDPHGIDPLVGCVRSAFAVAGFTLDRVLDWRGRIDADGTIEEDAEFYDG